MFKCVVLGDLVVIMLAIGHKIGGSNPAEGDGFLRAIKNPQYYFLRRGNKAVGPM
jgi:hypothetical protein